MVNERLIKEFGLRIRQLRTDRNISQEKLSFSTGFHRTYIAKVFEINVSELLDFSSINPKHSYKKYEIKTED
jgi:transcriptional regulator with XRE-family HTH domain